jgi:hypothetical protein
VALCWAKTGQPVKEIETETQVDLSTFRVGNLNATLNWADASATSTP